MLIYPSKYNYEYFDTPRMFYSFLLLDEKCWIVSSNGGCMRIYRLFNVAYKSYEMPKL